MRDLNKVAEKLDGLWNTGKMNKPVQPKPVMNTPALSKAGKSKSKGK